MGIDRDVWLKALAEAGADVTVDDRDAVTLGEFAEMFGLKRTTASGQLERLVEKGLATRTKKWASNSRGHHLHLTAYRLTEKPKAEGKRGRRHGRTA